MKPKFSIIKKAYLWVGFGALLLAGAWAMFFSNARLSEEFTGGVKISVEGSLDQEKLKTDLQEYLTTKGYLNANIATQEEENITKLSLRTDVENDEKVNVLSKDIQKFLVDKDFIKSPAMILEQSITGPSVG